MEWQNGQSNHNSSFFSLTKMMNVSVDDIDETKNFFLNVFSNNRAELSILFAINYIIPEKTILFFDVYNVILRIMNK